MWSLESMSLAFSTMEPPRPTTRGSERKEGGRISSTTARARKVEMSRTALRFAREGFV
jgi:hypothetical protein